MHRCGADGVRRSEHIGLTAGGVDVDEKLTSGAARVGAALTARMLVGLLLPCMLIMPVARLFNIVLNVEGVPVASMVPELLIVVAPSVPGRS